ncbi:MAG: hypothetical protein Q6360_13230 [Candidatus Brocadiales bacterium]|nr:hypothetical protein [Candidatus Brocadiales bacterium]
MEPVINGANRKPDGTFGAGNNANPAGRPKGTSIKDRVRKWLDEHPDDMEAFVKHFVKESRDLSWQMLEGRPSQGIGQAEDLPPLPLIPLHAIRRDNSIAETTQPE